MSNCPNCGHIVETNASACANCGAIFNNGGWSPSSQSVVPPETPSWLARISYGMHSFTYWLCFTLVALATIYAHCVRTLLNLGVEVPYSTMMSMVTSFGELTPQMLVHHLPRELVKMLNLVVLLLVVRRLWLSICKRKGVPHSYAGIAKALGYVGATSFILFALGILLTVAIHAGSGVPAAMLLFPALLCVPWAFALAEVMSFQQASKRET